MHDTVWTASVSILAISLDFLILFLLAFFLRLLDEQARSTVNMLAKVLHGQQSVMR